MVESKELEDFVRSACLSIQKGVTEGLEVKFPIEFEMSVVTGKGNDGKFKLLVVNDLEDYAKEEISRIKFFIGEREASSGRIRFFRE